MDAATARRITVVGIPMDLGQSRRGVDMGPSATRYAGLDAQLRRLGYRTENLGNLPIPDRDTLPAEGGMAFLPAAAEAARRRRSGRHPTRSGGPRC